MSLRRTENGSGNGGTAWPDPWRPIVLAVLLCLSLFGTLPASAAGTGAASHAASLTALTFRMAGDDLRMRMVIMFDRKPDYSTLIFGNPYRFVIDLPETRFGFDRNSLAARGLVQQVRYGMAGKGRSRLILTLRGPFKIEDMRVLKNENEPGYRLVADMVATSDNDFVQQLKGPALLASAAVSGDKSVTSAVPKHVFTVMIDPGHGGIDSGAESPTGIKEKDLTLAFGKELRDRLMQEPDIKVLMTRSDDTYLRLSERVRLARQHDADLFISIHADTINQADIRGATVYTISDKASDAVAKAMADRENRSDSLGGAVAPVAQPEVADILQDLTRRETHNFSLSFAEKVINHLEQGKINLTSHPHRFAGFQVLRSPDVPSVLIEMGYLSNPDDIKLITDPKWRRKLADELALAVVSFEKMRQPAVVSNR
ncbi:MAG: N-acetylmuramoyl-L-alanine amidase [Rhizobiales bacterium]|nr:N-acetylmuramoyl-L-alanine amidase [Hyphomicrobiales bacterium]